MSNYYSSGHKGPTWCSMKRVSS